MITPSCCLPWRHENPGQTAGNHDDWPTQSYTTPRDTIEKVRAEVAALRRLTILRLLDEGGKRGNSAVLERGLLAWHVPDVSRESVNADIRWLAAAGLLRTDLLAADLIGVVISDRGERAARGEDWVDGVARPSLD